MKILGGLWVSAQGGYFCISSDWEKSQVLHDCEVGSDLLVAGNHYWLNES